MTLEANPGTTERDSFRAYREAGIKATVLLADRLKDLGYHYATRSGVSISLSDMVIPGQKEAIIDAADGARRFTRFLEASGFGRERPFTRMYRGRLEPVGDLALRVAIAGPELG